MKKFSKGGVEMFSLKNFLTMFFIAILCLCVKIVPAYAAIQTDSNNFVAINSTDTIISADDRTNELIHAPPKITLTVENNLEVETFYPEGILEIPVVPEKIEVIAENNPVSGNLYTEKYSYSEEFLPKITLTVEDDILVETFYPSADNPEFYKKKVIPAKIDNYVENTPTVSVISLSLDGSNSVQFFESGEPYLTSLNLVTGFSDISDGLVVRADFLQFL